MGDDEHEIPIDGWLWVDRDESTRLWNELAETDPDGKSTDQEAGPAAQEDGDADQKAGPAGPEVPSGDDGNETPTTERSPPAGEADSDRRIWDERTGTAEEGTQAPPAASSARAQDEAADDRIWNQTSGGESARGGQSAETPTQRTAEEENADPFDGLPGQDRDGADDSGGAIDTGTQSDRQAVEALFDDIEEFHSLSAGSQVLVVGHPDHDRTDEICPEFLTVGDQTERNVLFITTGQAPARRLDVCQRNESWSGGKVKVLTVGDEVSDTQSEGPTEIRGNSVTYEHVSSPTNISKIGVIITQTLKQWRADDRQTTLCFHSLSTLAQYVQSETLFKFVFTLKGKLDSFGITGHYHMDPSKHDDQEIGTFSPMFDFTIRVSQDGTVDID